MNEIKEDDMFKLRLLTFEIINAFQELAPLPRSGHRLCCIGSNLYSVGGFNNGINVNDYEDDLWEETCPIFRELWKFNCTANKWTKVETTGNFPPEMASHYALSYGPNIIVYGGTDSQFGESSSNQIHVCTLHNNDWINVKTHGSFPAPLYGQSCAVDGNLFYTVGGTTGFDYNMDVHCLDRKTYLWSFLVPNRKPAAEQQFPEGRYRHEVVHFNNRLYVFGGGTKDLTYSLSSIHFFEIETLQWELAKPASCPRTGEFPASRKCHALFKFRNWVYIHGGLCDDDDDGLNDTWRIDLSKMVWHKLPLETPASLYFHSAAVNEQECSVYLFGGVYRSKDNRTNKLFRAFLDVPKLSILSWKALLFYAPRLLRMDRSSLLGLGIPYSIVRELTT